MAILILGIVIFFAAHSVSIIAPDWRDRMHARFGENAWKGAYSLVTLAGLLLMISGYGAARLEQTFLYYPPAWLSHVTALLMVFVFPLLLATYFPGHIKSALKHPTLVATKTWALAHLLANGGTADVLLFGAFLVWAVVDRISLKRRKASAAPSVPPRAVNDVIAIAGGLALYAGFAFWAHKAWIGVSPFG